VHLVEESRQVTAGIRGAGRHGARGRLAVEAERDLLGGEARLEHAAAAPEREPPVHRQRVALAVGRAIRHVAHETRTVGELEQALAGIHEMRARRDARGPDAGGVDAPQREAGDPRDEVEAVHGDVPDRAAVLAGLVVPAGALAGEERMLATERGGADLADGAGADQLAHLEEDPGVAHVEHQADRELLRGGEPHNLVILGQRRAHRLVGQDVAAGVEAVDDDAPALGEPVTHDHCIAGDLGQHLAVVGVGEVDALVAGELLPGGGILLAHRDDGDVRMGRRARDEIPDVGVLKTDEGEARFHGERGPSVTLRRWGSRICWGLRWTG